MDGKVGESIMVMKESLEGGNLWAVPEGNKEVRKAKI